LILSEFGWKPQYDNLEGIVDSALRWEDALSRRNRRD
jgi:UDP-glucose 4-epimerase